MRSRYGKRIEIAAQISEHLSAVPDLDAALGRLDVFGIVLHDRRRHDDDIGLHIAGRDMGGIMSDEDADARFDQLVGIAALPNVGTAHDEALVVGDAGDTAHTHTADSDEMYDLDRLLLCLLGHCRLLCKSCPHKSIANRREYRGRRSIYII